jgi:hypothetical protein
VALSKATDFGDGVFTPDGASVIFRTNKNELYSIPATDGTAVKLQAKGATGLRSLSPDGRWAVYFTNQDGNSGLYDLYLSSTTAAQAAVTACPDTSGDLYGPAFTADSAYSLVALNVDANTQAGALQALKLADGTKQSLATANWIWRTATDAKVVWNDNFDGTAGTADISALDLAKGGKPTLLAVGADPDFILSTDKKTVYFGMPDGLYSIAVP